MIATQLYCVVFLQIAYNNIIIFKNENEINKYIDFIKNGDNNEYLLYKFHWLGLRLKFTDDEVRGLIDDFF